MTGSTTVTIAPGVGGTLFQSVGPIHPHQYYPNQVFAQDWIYEGLVSYGTDGQIIPALATSWSLEENTENGGTKVTFTLRSNVLFHDGTEFNCTAVKLNFDHVLTEPVRQRHGWFGAVSVISNWYCQDNEEFVIETSETYYPLLQEFAYTRPLRIASTLGIRCKGSTVIPFYKIHVIPVILVVVGDT